MFPWILMTHPNTVSHSLSTLPEGARATGSANGALATDTGFIADSLLARAIATDHPLGILAFMGLGLFLVMAQMTGVDLGAAGEPEPTAGFLVMVTRAPSGERFTDLEFELETVLILGDVLFLFEREEVKVGRGGFHEIAWAQFDKLDFAVEGEGEADVTFPAVGGG